MSHPLFEIVTTSAGAISIRNKVVNEIMHNPVGPWLEANALYIEQSKLREALLSPFGDDLVVFDVGLGAAANALAAIHCVEELHRQIELGQRNGALRKMRLISFEKDLSLLEFALKNADQFDHFKGYEKAIEQILSQKHWENERIEWTLHHGDFLDCIDQESALADIVFFDPYSPMVNIEMWTADCFKKLRAKCRDEKGRGAFLYTYSQATPIRAALLVAGFYVGAGAATGLKEETTQATTRLHDLRIPFGDRWLQRWKKSGTPYPLGLPVEQQAWVSETILNHSQFLINRI